MVLPYELTELWKRAHTFYYALSSVTEQLTLAEFLNKGYFTKHHKAMRKLYHEKALFLKEELEKLPQGIIQSELSDGSTYITAKCIGKTAEELKAVGRRCGVKLLSMNSYNIHKMREPLQDDALVIGFGDLSREQIKTGIRLLNTNLQ
jgi:GntR family transcriptional regulator/MocR family aminotransferase